MHLSVAMGVPTVALFFHMPTRRWGHPHPPHQMLDLTAAADSIEKMVAQVVAAIATSDEQWTPSSRFRKAGRRGSDLDRSLPSACRSGRRVPRLHAFVIGSSDVWLCDSMNNPERVDEMVSPMNLKCELPFGNRRLEISSVPKRKPVRNVLRRIGQVGAHRKRNNVFIPEGVEDSQYLSRAPRLNSTVGRGASTSALFASIAGR